MATVKAAGYANAATTAQANQILYNRGIWNVTVQADGTKVLIGKLPVGHRLLPELCSIFANAATPALVADVCVAADSNKLIAAATATGGAALRAGVATSAAPYVLAEALGVDYDNDRDIYLLLTDAPNTAPAGAKVVVNIASIAVARGD